MNKMPADNPEYFSLGILKEPNKSFFESFGDLEPTHEVFESLITIEKLAGKQNNSNKSRKKRISNSLRRLFTPGSRRESASENEYLPSPSSPLSPPHSYGSLPSSPKRPVQQSRPASHPASLSSITTRSTTTTSPSSCRPATTGQGGPVSLVTGRCGLQLHSPPCRGWRPAQQPAVLVLYSGGCVPASRYKEYLMKLLAGQPAGPNCGSVRLEQLGQGEDRLAEELLYHARLVLIIISPGFISWLEEAGVVIGQLLSPSRVLGLLLGVDHADITPVVASCLLTLPCWNVIALEENTEEQTEFQIGKTLTEFSEKIAASSVAPREAKFKIFPKKLSQSQAKIMLILDSSYNQLEREQFELLVQLDEKHFSIEETRWVKDDLVQVELPGLLFRTTAIASLELRLGGLLLGCRQCKLESAATQLETAWQTCADPVTVLSDTLDTRLHNIQDIDLILSTKLSSEYLPTHQSSNNINLSTTNESTLIKEESFFQDRSNLLHFAAKNGLTRLCRTLLSIGYTRYLGVPNLVGLVPAECAEQAGHRKLAQELEPGSHEYQYPEYPQYQPVSSPLLEGEDGYLLPTIPPPAASGHSPKLDSNYQNVFNEYQTPSQLHGPSSLGPINENSQTIAESIGKAKESEVTQFELYQVPPTPVPLLRPRPPAIATASTPPPARRSSFKPPQPRLSADSYIPMQPTPPLRKAMSEPRSRDVFPIPKSGSFSHFTVGGDRNTAGSAMSRHELIEKFCREKPDLAGRPGSTPPSLSLPDQDTSPHIAIPKKKEDLVNLYVSSCSAASSSPLEHHIHTEPNIDGLVYLPMDAQDSETELESYYEEDKQRNLDVEEKIRNNQDPDESFKVKTILGRLSPCKSKIGFSMGSMRRRKLKANSNENNFDLIAIQQKSAIVEKVNDCQNEVVVVTREESSLYDFPRSLLTDH